MAFFRCNRLSLKNWLRTVQYCSRQGNYTYASAIEAILTLFYKLSTGFKGFSSSVEFDYRDAINLECRLTEEEILTRDQVKQYCQDKLVPRILKANRNEGNCNIS